MTKEELARRAFIYGLPLVGWVYLFFNWDILPELLYIARNTMDAIIAFGILVFGFLVIKLKFERHFSWKEFVSLAITLPLGVLSLSACFYAWTTDIIDEERLHGYVKEIEYQEYSETEECDSTGCDCISNPPSWTIYTNIYEKWNKDSSRAVNISESEYINIAKYWYHSSWKNKQRSVGSKGDISCRIGTTWKISATSDSSQQVPVALNVPFVNYFRAAYSIRKKSGLKESYKNVLPEYPPIVRTDLGPISIKLTLDTRGNSNPFMDSLNLEIRNHLMKIGGRKEVNIIIIFTNEDRNFVNALNEHWIGGKKNDLIVVINNNWQTREINWVEIMSWSPHEYFKIYLRDNIQNLKYLSSASDLARTIVKQVNAPDEAGWKRFEMRTGRYLLADINLALWADILMILFILLLHGPLIFWFLRN